MAWNEPGKDKNPWNKGSEQGPPDLPVARVVCDGAAGEEAVFVIGCENGDL